VTLAQSRTQLVSLSARVAISFSRQFDIAVDVEFEIGAGD